MSYLWFPDYSKYMISEDIKAFMNSACDCILCKYNEPVNLRLRKHRKRMDGAAFAGSFVEIIWEIIQHKWLKNILCVFNSAHKGKQEKQEKIEQTAKWKSRNRILAG